MDTASEAETAASLHTASDAGQTVNSSTYVDPNSAYPHPQSLQSPVAIVPERNSGEDIATQYVTAKAGELRVMNAHGAKEMADYLDEHFEQVVEFVRMHRLYDNEVFKPSAETGSGRTMRTLVFNQGREWDEEHVKREWDGYSLTSSQDCSHNSEEWTRQDTGGFRMKPRTDAPVSYTHLTLPTILLV